jgi:hypothetical protein
LRDKAVVANRVENFEKYTRQWGAHAERVEDNRLAGTVIEYRLRGKKKRWTT